MLIVIPVGPRDLSILALQSQAMAALGLPQSEVLYVAVPSVFEEVVNNGPHTNTVCTEDEFDQPWPIGPDRMWLWTVRYLDSIGNRQPWLWLEPDACPVQKEWDTKLAAAYEEAGKPFFGFTRPVKWKSPDGVIALKEDDPMLLGVAIYPPGMSRDPELVPLLNDLAHSVKGAHPTEPFDMYLRYYMFRRGVHSTTMIYDRWRTCDYQRDDFEQLVCEPLKDEPTAEGGVIPAEALLVHGCKDGSLHRLVIEENVVLNFGTNPEGLTQKKLDDLRDKLVSDDLRLDYQGPKVLKKVAEETQQEVAGFKFIPSKVLPDNVALVGTSKENMVKVVLNAPPSEVLQQRVLDVIKGLDAPRLRGVMEKTGLDKEQVKAVLPLIGYECSGPGWITKSKKKKPKTTP